MPDRSHPRCRPRPYDFDALAARMGLSANAAGERLGVRGTTLQEYRARGLTEQVADRLATAAGLHPAQVWSSWVADGLSPLDEVFLASGWRRAWLWAEEGALGEERAA